MTESPEATIAVPDRPVAIVTGGSRGIGRSIVTDLARRGYSVLDVHSSPRHDAFAPGTHTNVSCLHLDVTAASAAGTAFTAAEAMGDCRVLINNAGITGPLGSIVDLDDDQLHRLVDVNLMAPVRWCREAAQRWVGRLGPRHIVNIGSIAARTGSPQEYVAYAATKAAIHTLSVGLARELGPYGVYVNAVAPGTIHTSIHASAGEPERAARVGQSVPFGRPGTPDEVAEVVGWLVSERNTYVTGAVIEAGGGL